MGGAVALSLENNRTNKIMTLMELFNLRFSVRLLSGKLRSSLGKVGKSIVKGSMLDLGVAGGVYADSAISFADGGLIIKLSADIANDMGTRLTSDSNTSLDLI